MCPWSPHPVAIPALPHPTPSPPHWGAALPYAEHCRRAVFMLLTLAPGSSPRTSPKVRGPRRAWSAACSEEHGGTWEAWALLQHQRA